jgi:hypothetical protein
LSLDQRTLLRIAVAETKEAKFYRQQQRERLDLFERDPQLENLSGATKAAMLQVR